MKQNISNWHNYLRSKTSFLLWNCFHFLGNRVGVFWKLSVENISVLLTFTKKYIIFKLPKFTKLVACNFALQDIQMKVCHNCYLSLWEVHTAQKNKFSIKNFFISGFLPIWSHLLKKLIEKLHFLCNVIASVLNDAHLKIA